MIRWYLAAAAALALLAPGLATSDAADGSRTLATAVEGHSTFVTIDIEPASPAPLYGLATCRPLGSGIPLVGALLGAVVGCGGHAEAAFATPGAFPAPTDDDPLTPTGRARTVIDANRLPWTTFEFTYPLPYGGTGVTYMVAVDEVFRHPETHEEYNFVLGLPPLPVNADWRDFSLTSGRER